MARKKLILRFRDPSTEINTISAHEEVIQQHGKVLWGWWKKDGEELSSEVTDFIKEYSTGYVYLIDRRLNRFYKAIVSKVYVDNNTVEYSCLVPKYYRDISQVISVWFELTNIIAIKNYPFHYDELFAKNRNPTYLIDGGEPDAALNENIERIKLTKNNVLLLSDLHFGENYGFCLDGERNVIAQNKKNLCDTIVDDLRYMGVVNDIALLVITGDFTTKGDWSESRVDEIVKELHLLCQILNIPHDKIIALPGNHDIIRFDPEKSGSVNEQAVYNQSNNKFERPFRDFVEELTGRHWKEPLSYNLHYSFVRVGFDFDLTVLNSCKVLASTKWTEYGYVGSEGIDALKAFAEKSTSKIFRAIVLHHHLLPVNNVEYINDKGISLTIDAIDLIKESLKKDVNVAIHGHQHFFNMSKYTHVYRSNNVEKTINIVANGSSSVDSSRRMDSERNSYTLLKFEHDEVTLIARELLNNGDSGVTIIEKKL